MKLTNYIRDAYVKAIMDDVPSVDYDEQATALVVQAMDEAFKRICPTADKELMLEQGWLSRQYLCTPGGLDSVCTVGPTNYEVLKPLPVWAKLEVLAKKKKAQQDQRNSLRAQIRGVAKSVTTRKALAAALPEFEKYLPEDDAKAIRSLPVVQNVVADFVKAGWPKSVTK